MRLRKGRAALAVGVLAMGISAFGAAPTQADPVDTASASAYTASASLAGNSLIPPTPEVSAVLPPGGDEAETVLPLDVAPVAINGTLSASAKAHVASDIDSALTVNTQAVEGPYNATGVATVENLEVLVDVVGVGVSVLSATALRSEAAAVCVDGVPQYTANSEIIDLDVAGTDVPLNGPLEQILGTIIDLIETLGIEDVVDVGLNEVTEFEGGGIAVDALRVDVLAVLGDPLISIVIGHAEVGPVTCADLSNPGEVVKSGPPTVIAGDSFEYTVTVNNISDRCALENVRVTDVIQGPAGTQVTSTNPTATSVTGQAESGGITVVWDNVGPIAAGQSLALKVTVSTPANAPAATKFADDALAEYTCNGDPFDDTDHMDGPEIQKKSPDTGIASSFFLVAGGMVIVAAFGLRGLRRRATT